MAARITITAHLGRAIALVFAGCVLPSEVGTQRDASPPDGGSGGSITTSSSSSSTSSSSTSSSSTTSSSTSASTTTSSTTSASSTSSSTTTTSTTTSSTSSSSSGGTSLVVSAQTDIFSAGQPGGPIAIAVPSGATEAFFAAPGSGLSCCGTASEHAADGGANLSTWIEPSPPTGISGIKHLEKSIFLVGLFMSDAPPDPSSTPPTLFYAEAQVPSLNTLWDGSPSFSPLLDQTFFIGDGLTGTAAGDPQTFYIPSGATRLFLGFADATNCGDFTHGFGTPSPAPPGMYDDNSGALSVTYTFE